MVTYIDYYVIMLEMMLFWLQSTLTF